MCCLPVSQVAQAQEVQAEEHPKRSCLPRLSTPSLFGWHFSPGIQEGCFKAEARAEVGPGPGRRQTPLCGLSFSQDTAVAFSEMPSLKVRTNI